MSSLVVTGSIKSLDGIHTLLETGYVTIENKNDFPLFVNIKEACNSDFNLNPDYKCYDNYDHTAVVCHENPENMWDKEYFHEGYCASCRYWQVFKPGVGCVDSSPEIDLSLSGHYTNDVFVNSTSINRTGSGQIQARYEVACRFPSGWIDYKYLYISHFLGQYNEYDPITGEASTCYGKATSKTEVKEHVCDYGDSLSLTLNLSPPGKVCEQ